MIIENPDSLRAWLTTTLEPICDADPAALAKDVLLLLKKPKDEADLKELCVEQLDVFLHKETRNFVESLFVVIGDKSYLPPAFAAAPPPAAPVVTKVDPPAAKPAAPVEQLYTSPGSSTNRPIAVAPTSQVSPSAVVSSSVVVPASVAQVAVSSTKNKEQDDKTQPIRLKRSPIRTRSTEQSLYQMQYGAVGSERRERCRDYDQKGFCLRGDKCPYDHGPDPAVVKDSVLPSMIHCAPPEMSPPNFSMPPPPNWNFPDHSGHLKSMPPGTYSAPPPVLPAPIRAPIVATHQTDAGGIVRRKHDALSAGMVGDKRETLYEKFVSASTFREIITAFSQICVALDLDPLSDHVSFYTKLRSVLTHWKSEKLWSLFDKKLQQKEYKEQRACQGLRVLIIGAGPCGLRMAIECALLGAKVVVVEKRDQFSRNNLLHIWTFVIQDLRSLGAKLFYPRFCTGEIGHISIRQLQCILLKAALVLGVEVHENISFEELLEPSLSRSDTRGWHARFSPESHHVADYEFDVLIGADGKRNTVPGFPRKVVRGALAIGITANFINKHSWAEEQVRQKPGVTSNFKPDFFNALRDETGIDLENIVYYKDETHYFVMCAKKQSLVDKGVIVQDFNDVHQLLSTANISEKALFNYARQAADFSTNGALPHLDFATNHNNRPDVAIFDFGSFCNAENSCRIVERNGHRLVVGIIGDSLHEPFWPTGSGCGRGFLGAFDTAWLLRNYASGQQSPLELLAERESFYRPLKQALPENLQQQTDKYTIDPRTRYPTTSVDSRPPQVAHLFDTDVPQASGSCLCYGSSGPEGFVRNVDHDLASGSGTDSAKRLRLSAEPSASTLPQLPMEFWQGYIRRGRLLRWCQWLVQPYMLRVENLTTSFRNGFVLGAILNRFRPDLIDYATDLDPKDATANNRKILTILHKHLNIAYVPDDFATAGKAQMTQFISTLQEYFAAHGDANASNGSLLRNSAPPSASISLSLVASASSPPRAFVQPQQQPASAGSPQKRKLSPEMASAFACGSESIRPTERSKAKEDEESEERHRKRVEQIAAMRSVRPDYGEGLQENKPSQKRTTLVEKLCPDRVTLVEDLLVAESTPSRCSERREEMSKPPIKVRRFEPDKIASMESKLHDSVTGKLCSTEKMEKERDHNLFSQDTTHIAEKTAFLKRKAEQGFREDAAPFGVFDKTSLEFDNRMQLPNKTGLFNVGALAEHHEKAIPHKPDVDCKPPIAPTLSKPCSLPPGSQNSTCYICQTRVYFAERMCAGGHYMHRRCYQKQSDESFASITPKHQVSLESPAQSTNAVTNSTLHDSFTLVKAGTTASHSSGGEDIMSQSCPSGLSTGMALPSLPGSVSSTAVEHLVGLLPVIVEASPAKSAATSTSQRSSSGGVMSISSSSKITSPVEPNNSDVDNLDSSITIINRSACMVDRSTAKKGLIDDEIADQPDLLISSTRKLSDESFASRTPTRQVSLDSPAQFSAAVANATLNDTFTLVNAGTTTSSRSSGGEDIMSQSYPSGFLDLSSGMTLPSLHGSVSSTTRQAASNLQVKLGEQQQAQSSGSFKSGGESANFGSRQSSVNAALAPQSFSESYCDSMLSSISVVGEDLTLDFELGPSYHADNRTDTMNDSTDTVDGQVSAHVTGPIRPRESYKRRSGSLRNSFQQQRNSLCSVKDERDDLLTQSLNIVAMVERGIPEDFAAREERIDMETCPEGQLLDQSSASQSSTSGIPVVAGGHHSHALASSASSSSNGSAVGVGAASSATKADDASSGQSILRPPPSAVGGTAADLLSLSMGSGAGMNAHAYTTLTQDVTVGKKRHLQESDTLSPFDSALLAKNGILKCNGDAFAATNCGTGSSIENKTPEDIQAENAEPKRLPMILCQALDDRDRTIRILQPQIDLVRRRSASTAASSAAEAPVRKGRSFSANMNSSSSAQTPTTNNNCTPPPAVSSVSARH